MRANNMTFHSVRGTRDGCYHHSQTVPQRKLSWGPLTPPFPSPCVDEASTHRYGFQQRLAQGRLVRSTNACSFVQFQPAAIWPV